jgi:sugar lactone lactonase YvrE
MAQRPTEIDMNDAVCAVDCQDKLGEGAIWDAAEQAVWWVDLPHPGRIHRFVPARGTHDVWVIGEMVMSMSKRRDGTLLVASHHGLNIFDPAKGSMKRVAAPEAHLPQNRSNDGATDAAGRFWFGTMANNVADDNAYFDPGVATGILYKVESDFRATPMLGGIGIHNATCWSPDARTMYFADTVKGEIYACDYDLALGAFGPKRVFSNLTGHGHPDGATVDAEGYLWSARWEGNAVLRFAPDGTLDRVLPVPASRVTSCTFGGPDLDTLYITTSRLHLSDDELDKQPQAGGLFAVKPDVKGVPTSPFAG